MIAMATGMDRNGLMDEPSTFKIINPNAPLQSDKPMAAAQFVRPGTPVIHGVFNANVGMKSGSPASATPQFVSAAFGIAAQDRKTRCICSLSARC